MITNNKISSEELELILKSNFMEALKDSGLRSFSFSDRAQTLLIGELTQPVAILIYREIETLRLVEIDFIGTSIAFRRKGLAGQLLKNLSGRYEELWLELSSTNAKAMSFYKKQGFLAKSERPHYYSRGVHAINMVKTRGG